MAAALTLYLVDLAAPNGGGHGTLQVDNFYPFGTGGPPGTATLTTSAWQPGATTYATNESSDFSYASVQGSGTFSSTLGPSSGTGTTKCFASSIPLLGAFDGSTWTIPIAVILTALGSSGSANLLARIYKGTDPTGTGATELTTSTLVFSGFSMNSSSAQNTNVSWSPGSFSMNGEYLFLALACEVQSGTVSFSGTEINLRQDATNSAITTANFTPSSTMYWMGTGGGSGANLGPDNSQNQFYTGYGTFAQLFPSEGLNQFLASPAFDPNSSGPSGITGGPGGCVFLAGDADGDNDFQCYIPATNTQVVMVATLPSGCYGGGAGACLNGVSYFLGGQVAGSGPAVATVFSWVNSQTTAGTFGTSYTALPEIVLANMAVAVGNLIYHGGGDDLTNTYGHFYKWDPLTDIRTTLASMPTGLSGSACVHYNGIIYMFGGYTNAATEADTNVCYAYTISSNIWRTLGNYPITTSFGSACIYNNTIYMVDGGGGTSLRTYNIPGDSWTTVGSVLSSAGTIGSILFVSPAQIQPPVAAATAMIVSAAAW